MKFCLNFVCRAAGPANTGIAAAINGVSVLSVLSVGLLLSGCATTDRTLNAASTKLEVRNSKTAGMTLVLPKELDTTNLKLDLDPKTGHIQLTADKLKSSSQAIIESAGAQQAASIAALSKTITDLVPLVAKAAAVAIAPEDTLATEAIATAAAAPAAAP